MSKNLLLAAFFGLLAGSIFGLVYFSRFNPFRSSSSAQLLFSESFPDSEQVFYQELFANSEAKLTSNLTLSKTIETHPVQSREELNNHYLLNIYVPVTDFYHPTPEITEDNLLDFYYSPDSASDYALASVLNLTPDQQLVTVDGEYFLDTFTSGALFEYLVATSEDFTLADSSLVSPLISPTLPTFPTEDSTLTFTQTGVTAFGRNLNSKLAQVGDPTYFSAQIAPFLSSFDLTHTSSEASFSSAASGSNICANPAFAQTLTNIGLDIVELTGNHNLDCGADDALQTLDKYQELNIKTVGGGRNLKDAAKSLELSQKGTNITLLAYNESTGGATTGDYPGANPYSEANAQTEIKNAKSHGDVVIVDIQYYECNAYDDAQENTTCDYADSSAGDQINFFRHLIDLGADVVVGTSAHQPQTYEQYHDGQIYYGLGNLFFDQYWWPGTSRSLVLVHYFYNNRLLQTRKYATVYDQALQPRLMSQTELSTFLTRLNNARP